MFVNLIQAAYRTTYRIWSYNEALVISAWIEFCWGWWVLSNPSHGTARHIYELALVGPYLGAYMVLHGIARYVILWRHKTGVLVWLNSISIFLFSIMCVAVVWAQTVYSWLTIMYFGLLLVQMYLYARAKNVYDLGKSIKGERKWNLR